MSASRLRDYIRVYPNTLSADDCIAVHDYIELSTGLYDVDLPGIARYEMTHITGALSQAEIDGTVETRTAAMALHKRLAGITLNALHQYQQDIGLADFGLFQSKDDPSRYQSGGLFSESFFVRNFRAANQGFVVPYYDANNHATGSRFLSFTYFLNDTLDTSGSMVFNHPIGEMDFEPRAGTLVMHPSNWMYMSGHKVAKGVDCTTIKGYYAWAPSK